MRSLRKATPESLRLLGRRTYVAAGARTATWRAEPDFIMAGVQRGGTTSLFRALMAHPQVVRPTFHKGVNYFDLGYYHGRDWYRGHFPLRPVAERRTEPFGPPVYFEASGYYIYHPFAMERVARDLPDVKVVVMLRDPVERAYSAYQHELARGYEWETFERALDLEEERLVGEVDRMRRDPTYESFTHRHHSYQARGRYAEQLGSVFSLFPREHVHIMQSEAFFDDPAGEYDRLQAFLGLRPAQVEQFDRYNAQPRSPMQDATRERLRRYFEPWDAKLSELLGEPLRWQQQESGAGTSSPPAAAPTEAEPLAPQ